jgi:hypothetical protein
VTARNSQVAVFPHLGIRRRGQLHWRQHHSYGPVQERLSSDSGIFCKQWIILTSTLQGKRQTCICKMDHLKIHGCENKIIYLVSHWTTFPLLKKQMIFGNIATAYCIRKMKSGGQFWQPRTLFLLGSLYIVSASHITAVPDRGLVLKIQSTTRYKHQNTKCNVKLSNAKEVFYTSGSETLVYSTTPSFIVY